MIKLFAHTLNVNEGIHPVAHYALETLVTVAPERFSKASLPDCDCVLVSAPAAPPYCFDGAMAKTIARRKKPIFVFNDADGAAPDCGVHPGYNPDDCFVSFVRNGSGIRGYFYREWFDGYERPDLPFPLLTYELSGYTWSQHPKDALDWIPESRERFHARQTSIFMAQTLHVASRVAFFAALDGKTGVVRHDLKSGLTTTGVLLKDHAKAKMVIALEGAGVKCICHCEAPLSSVMVMHDIAMRETYPWIDGDNCIRLIYERNAGEGSLVHNLGRGKVCPEPSIAKMDRALADHDRLYDIYRSGVENGQRYLLRNYWRNHVGAEIERLL